MRFLDHANRRLEKAIASKRRLIELLKWGRTSDIAKVMLWAISNLPWDGRKARSNGAKHGVSFEEAQTVFLDENARLIDDPDHTEDEERFLLSGYRFQGRRLIVIHCYQEDDSVIRLISARRATRREEEVYWSFR